jgi:uncharacterized heparinase superfamily protein
VGQNGNGGHAHNDLSSYELSYGAPVVVDSGTYLYTADPAARDVFRSSRAHNVVVVDRLDMRPLPVRVPFQLPEYARFAVEEWQEDGEVSFLRGWHDGYRRHESEVTCHRTIRLERANQAVEIIDVVEGEGTRHVASLIHLAVGCDVEQEGRAVLRVKTDQRELTVSFNGAQRLEVEDGWVSSQYGVRERAKLIRATTEDELPLRLSYRMAPR